MSFEPTSNEVIDLADTRRVAITGAPGETYPTLSDEQQCRLEDALRHGHDRADDVLARTRNWKYGADDALAARHEKTFKRALDVDAPVRGGEVEWEPSRGEVEAARTLHELSAELVREVHGDRVTLYRGLSHELDFAFWQVVADWPDPGPLEYADSSPRAGSAVFAGLEPSFPSPSVRSVLSNYSASKRGAAYFCRLVLEQEFAPEDVALAANYVFTYEDPEYRYANDRGVVSPNAEFRVRGDRECPFDPDQLRVVVTGDDDGAPVVDLALPDLLARCPDLSRAEHEAMCRFVDETVVPPGVEGDGDFEVILDWAAEFDALTGSEYQDLVEVLVPDDEDEE